MNKTRLEAFSDGVLAIIITIMVLEIKMPHSASWGALKELLPVFVSYLLSFVYIGIYWGNHHHILHTVKHITPGIIWGNMNLLFWLSLIPFATGWMGENHFAPNTIVVYAVLLMVCGISFTILQYAIMRSDNKRSRDLDEAFSNLKAKGIISIICYGAAIPLAFVHTLISGILFVLTATIWLIPDRKIEKALQKASEEGA